MNNEQHELDSLRLLSDTQAELRDALNSLGRKEADGLIEHYLVYTAALINRVVEGYAYLRESRRFEASKFLIRTAIEAVFRVQAIRKKPDLLFRIAFAEYKEDVKWVRSLNGSDVEATLQAIDSRWTEFMNDYRNKYPEHELIEKELSARDASGVSGLDCYYNSHYRLYCRFTHAAFRASTGDLAKFESEDNRTMTLCALAAIDAVVSIGAEAPRLQSLKERLPRSDKNA